MVEELTIGNPPMLFSFSFIFVFVDKVPIELKLPSKIKMDH